jgi:AraC-like DNA-binding protein
MRFIFLIGYFGLKQKVIFSSEDLMVTGDSVTTQAKYSGSRLGDQEAKQYAARLTSHMMSSKPYLNPDLTLPRLAAELDISAHYLSQVINEQFNVNFFDFVNRYRVEAFKERIGDSLYRNFSLLGIAFECGFNSKSAFNRVFKKITGLTPSQFKKAGS